MVWLFTGRGYPWPIWPLVGWGIGVMFQYLFDYRSSRILSEEEEYEKLKKKTGGGYLSEWEIMVLNGVCQITCGRFNFLSGMLRTSIVLGIIAGKEKISWTGVLPRLKILLTSNNSVKLIGAFDYLSRLRLLATNNNFASLIVKKSTFFNLGNLYLSGILSKNLQRWKNYSYQHACF